MQYVHGSSSFAFIIFLWAIVEVVLDRCVRIFMRWQILFFGG